MLIELRGTEHNRRTNLFRGFGRFNRGLALNRGLDSPFARPGSVTPLSRFRHIGFKTRLAVHHFQDGALPLLCATLQQRRAQEKP